MMHLNSRENSHPMAAILSREGVQLIYEPADD
jgi:hypothetical protein